MVVVSCRKSFQEGTWISKGKGIQCIFFRDNLTTECPGEVILQYALRVVAVSAEGLFFGEEGRRNTGLPLPLHVAKFEQLFVPHEIPLFYV